MNRDGSDLSAEEAARELVASLQSAFNAHDPVAISEHYADDAAWGTVTGRELSGREEIAAFGRSVMPRLREQYVRYQVTRTLRLAPDVVAVRVRQTPVLADGQPTDAPAGVALYVVSRTAPGWRIVAGQVTFAVDDPD